MIKDVSGLVEKITKEIKDFTDVAVVGLSGGVDSMCVATLCMMALGKDNVYAIHMPGSKTDLTTEGKFNSNSNKIAEMLGVKELTIPVNFLASEIVNQLQLELGPLSTVNKGNARSRARMNILYGVAHHLGENLNKRTRVMGTGNLSEDFIGYDTKGGDALADIFPIGELFKSEVYQLAETFVELGLIDDDMIDRNPSAGLWDGQSDEEELGYTYNQMEPSIRKIIDEGWSKEEWNEIDEFVWNRHFANKHKHEAPPVINLRDNKILD